MTAKEAQLIQIAHYFNTNPWLGWVVAGLIAWTLLWKGIALWKAAGHRQGGWFIIMLVLNSLGILEIIYLAFFQRKSEE